MKFSNQMKIWKCHISEKKSGRLVGGWGPGFFLLANICWLFGHFPWKSLLYSAFSADLYSLAQAEKTIETQVCQAHLHLQAQIYHNKTIKSVYIFTESTGKKLCFTPYEHVDSELLSNPWNHRPTSFLHTQN